MTTRIDDLHPDDRPAVHRLLHDYLHWHVSTWAEAVGLGWSSQQVDAHLRTHDLVGRDWSELLEASADPERYVAALREEEALIGVVYARSRIEPYLEMPVGVLSWIAVDPAARGRGAGKTLMEAASSWMRDRSLPWAQLYVTAANHPAVSLYEASGYRVVDYRMLVPLTED